MFATHSPLKWVMMMMNHFWSHIASPILKNLNKIVWRMTLTIKES
jgi:hypothetical protein